LPLVGRPRAPAARCAGGTFDHPIGTPDGAAALGDTPPMRARTQQALSRLALLIGLAVLWPGPVLAADPPAVTTGDGGAATLLVVLLLGSLTAGLFFASPLRRRLARSSFASTTSPAIAPRAPGGELLGRLADRLHQRLAAATRRWPTLDTVTPLPPMLGGDIFFDDEQALAPGNVTGQAAPPATATPWSTTPVSGERYGPFR
jgi:hypothetical protein